MRYRSCAMALAAALCLVTTAPDAKAAPPADHVTPAAAAPSPLAVARIVPRGESVHVFVLMQLAVSDSIGRDSLALRRTIARGVGVMLTALDAERIPVYRGAILLRDSNDANQPTLRASPDVPAHDSLRRAERSPRDSSVLQLGVVRRR